MLALISPSLLRKEVGMGKCCIYAMKMDAAHIYYLKVALRLFFTPNPLGVILPLPQSLASFYG